MILTTPRPARALSFLAVSRSSGVPGSAAARVDDATIDLSELTFINVCGLRALARAAIRLHMAGRCLRLSGTSTRTRRLRCLLGWAELFDLVR